MEGYGGAMEGRREGEGGREERRKKGGAKEAVSRRMTKKRMEWDRKGLLLYT